VSATHPIHRPEQAIERLGGLPGGPELLAQALRRGDVSLVGGAVRDLLLGHWPRELDVTVAADSAGLATALAAAISPSERAYGHAVEPILHDRFGTASVVWDYGRVDIAELRAESYPSPGALPVVRAGSLDQDLARRDFTVNAISLPLAGPERGRLRAVEQALEDLAAGVLRVLHERSFVDDPTRILRLARYAARLGFTIEPQTRQLAERAVASGALATVSDERLGAELSLAVREAGGRAALRMLDQLGVLAALGMATPFDDELASEAEALLPVDGARDLLLMAVARRSAEDDELAREIVAAERPAIVFDRLEDRAPESVAIAGALAARVSQQAGATVREWFESARHVRLEIDGDDLLAAGVREGPELGARLRGTLRRKRERQLQGREQELRAALEPPAREGER
jgi:tRNA nucleotidyltransferase (CCA-adding enzyme)